MSSPARAAARVIAAAVVSLAVMQALIPRAAAGRQQAQSGAPPRVGSEAATLESLVRGRIEAVRSSVRPSAGEDRLLARLALPLFYEARAFEPAWADDPEGSRLLDGLERAVERAAEHGLDPADYHREAISELRALIRAGEATDTERADLDLLASDAFMVLGSHLLHGRVNPESINPEWLANRRTAELHVVLADALSTGTIEASLLGLAPAQPRYRSMMRALARLRTTADRGGWPSVAPGPSLEAGMVDGRVAALRARLQASQDLSPAFTGELFDEALAEAVLRFQERHGLDADGVVGPATLAALNVSAGDRAGQIATNLERWRWLPEELGERHIEVNIAGFDAKVVERGRVVRVHRAVVGRQYRQTPMFSGLMTYLVLSPFWHVPPSIAAIDKLPILKEDPAALSAQRIFLLDQADHRPVDPASVSWDAITGPEFNRRYRLRQDPGPQNALGTVKFMFPNRHNVYLHDTPTRELFARANRTFSSGCIRIEDPLALAEYLLADQPEWTRVQIDQTVAAGQERTVKLTAPVPVHLLYWTAWADADGTLHFREDVYGRDGTVGTALTASPPGL